MGGGLQGFQRVGKFYQDAREIGNMEVCNGCENTVVSGTNFCPHCGSKIENIVEITEKISTIEPLAENGINEDDGASNRLYIVSSIGIIAIIAIYLLSSSGPTYALHYEVTAHNGGEEFSVYYEYITPEGETEGYGWAVVPGCDEVITCNHIFEIDFEYKEAFETGFTIYCYGCEGDPPSVCIETLVDYYSIGLDCGFYSDPDDEFNFGLITDSAYVNRQVIDKIE